MRTIKLEPLTRVEGHGRVELTVEDGVLANVRVAVTESPRLFEGMVLGRSFEEVPALVCRICAICSGVHRVAAAGALERALGVQIPPFARMVRELLLLGGHLESHALHLFCLVLPDLRGRESVIEVLRSGDETASRGLALKGLGNRIQEISGGRIIHPVNVEVGGVVRLPDKGRIEELLAELEAWEGELPAVTEDFASPESYPAARPALGTRICVGGGAAFSLQGEDLILSGGRTVPGGKYRQVLAERAVSYSHAKHSMDGAAPLLAGALARLENAAERSLEGTPTAKLPEGIYGNNAAQGAEMLWALGRCRQLAEELLDCSENEPLRVAAPVRAGVGTEVVEAPRGVLVHHYALDDMGRVAAADIVTPTAVNQAAMEAQLRSDLEGVEEASLAGRAEQIVRAFDPCISCSVHVLRR